MDPYKQLARLLEDRMARHAGRAVAGLFCELGTITATGLKLDGFKHEIRDYLVADWEMKLEIPQASRVVKTASPVNADGSDIPGSTVYSDLTRLDFQQGDPGAVLKVRLNLKESLKPGDRVLAVPVNGGQDAVVICKVVG